ncbi:hypothetical protein OKJ48_03110 [Streptomyces kunmingensis]|uniref:Uncharacterized protein n=1 Tax=Streptomyces kunmingensis TaxID=68225 RepID=A0ABU6C3P7_9ACTN|nr:hypothetical protein [Streptomyces kunmingensis]MEB3959247.1 hypothetical protein [Streptomyces kunmingensis]
MGAWLYTPSGTGAAPAALHGHCRRVELWYSAELVQDLLTELGLLETSYAAATGAPHRLDASVSDVPRQLAHA